LRKQGLSFFGGEKGGGRREHGREEKLEDEMVWGWEKEERGEG
jgi:hypothetical protein